ncbi:MAG: protein kinase domain-containing protein [Persicimonas sp.]
MVDGPPPQRAAVGEMPEHLCTECMSLRFGREPTCVDCGAARPAQGWQPLSELGDAYLGRTVDRRFLLTRRLYRCGDEALYRATSLSDARHFGLWLGWLEAFDCSRQQLITRMVREVPGVHGLDPAHLVAVHELLEFSDDHIGVVMDYPPGMILDDVLAEDGPLEVERACKLGAQLAHALHQAHASGLVHRQLDPSTVVISQLPEAGETAQILHFGLPALDGRGADALNRRAFYSPEQRKKKGIDRASNLYGLGALLFFMLTGETPSPPLSANDSWGVRVETEMVRVSQARTADDVPGVLDTLVAAMMARSPLGRPEKIADVVELLEQYAGAHERAHQHIAPAEHDQPAPEARAGSPRQTLTSGSYFPSSRTTRAGQPSDQGPIPPPDASGAPASASDSPDATSPPSQEKLPDENLPGDLQTTNTTVFRAASAERTENFGWIKRPQTGEPPPAQTDASLEDSHQSDQDGQSNDSDGGSASSSGALYGKVKRPAHAVTPIGRLICATSDRRGRLLVADDTDTLWLATGPPYDNPDSLGELELAPRSVALWGDALLVGLANGKIERRDIDSADTQVLLETIDRASITGLAVDAHTGKVVASAASGRVYAATLVDETVDQIGDSDWERVRTRKEAIDIALAGPAASFAVLRLDGTVEVRNFEPPHTVLCEFHCSGGCSALALSPDGQLVAVVLDDTVHLYHAGSGQQIAAFDKLTHRPTAVFFDADNNLVGICQSESELLLWDLASDSAVAQRTRATGI